MPANVFSDGIEAIKQRLDIFAILKSWPVQFRRNAATLGCDDVMRNVRDEYR